MKERPSIAHKRMSIPGSIAEAAEALRAGTLTARQLTGECCARIRTHNPSLRAVITLAESQALAAASELDAELRRGNDRGPLHGIPIVHKDLYDTAGMLTTMGSRRHAARIPLEDATVVQRLKQAGTVLLGKASLSEFATHPSGRNVAYGDVRNPCDPSRSAGGSSSGTAAAVAAGLCLGGTGSDTGGSIRIPASWCGIVGLRPTFGLVSLAGAHARAYTLDVGGPMTRTVRDCALMLNAMAGFDPLYRYSVDVPASDYSAGLSQGVKGLRLGIIDDYTYRDVDPDVAKAVQAACAALSASGAHIETIRIPVLSGQLHYTALFDILLYEFNQILGDEYRASPRRDELYGEVVRSNLVRGAAVTRQAYERAVGEKPAQLAAFKRVFSRVDALLTPSVPVTAPPLDAQSDVWDRVRQFTLSFSFLGVPAISVPCGFSGDGLPIGIQVIADEMQEALLLRIASSIEAAACIRSAN